MGPPVPILQAPKKVFNGTQYCYGYPNSEQPVVLNINAKLRNFERTKPWGNTSRAEWRDYISIYPRLYQIRQVSRVRIEKWLQVGNNRGTFEAWGSAFRHFLRTEEEDQSMNVYVRKPGIPPEATWLNEQHWQKGADFGKRMGREIHEEEGEDRAEEDEEEEKFRLGREQHDVDEDVEQTRSQVDRTYDGPNNSQQQQKRKRENQALSTSMGTPFPPTVLASLPADRRIPHLSQQQFTLVELRSAARGFRTLHTEILRVAQRLDPGDALRSLLSNIAVSANLDVERAEGAVQTSSELLDYIVMAHAEAAKTDDLDQEAQIKRARTRAAYEMLPVGPADSQRVHARTGTVEQRPPISNFTRDSQVPEARYNTRSPTAPCGERVPSYELPDALAREHQPLFERSSSILYDPVSSHAGEVASRPNTAIDIQSSRSRSRGAPIVAANAGSYSRQTPVGDFDPVVGVNYDGGWNPQPRPYPLQPHTQFRQPAFTDPRDMPVYSVEEPVHHSSPYHQPPPRPLLSQDIPRRCLSMAPPMPSLNMPVWCTPPLNRRQHIITISTLPGMALQPDASPVPPLFKQLSPKSDNTNPNLTSRPQNSHPLSPKPKGAPPVN